MAPAIVLNALARWMDALHSVALAATLAGVVGSAVVASRLEERVYLWGRRRNALLSLAFAAALPLVAFVLAPVVAVIVQAALGWAGSGGWIAIVLVGGLWFTGAAAGSFFIVVIDLVISKTVAGFRARLTAAILCMLGLSFAVALLGAVSALALIDALRHGGLPSNIRVNADPDKTREAIDWMSQHPLSVACMVYGVAGLIGSPAALSASSKLAEAVMDRIHPLVGAFAAISRGERDVHVEEGGSRDFQVLSHRFNEMVDGLALAERMERAFGSYVSAPLLDRIRAQHGEAVVPASLLPH